MSTKNAVYIAINSVSAGASTSTDAKSDLLDHISHLVIDLTQDATVDQLNRLHEDYGLVFETRAGRITNVMFS